MIEHEGKGQYVEKENPLFRAVSNMIDLYTSSFVLTQCPDLLPTSRELHLSKLASLGITQPELIEFFGNLPTQAYLDSISSLVEGERHGR